jgi:3-methyladenine DNA glycosylase AlkC
LLKILGPENETEQGMFTNGYFLMPVAHFVEQYGLHDFNLSMHALYEITKRHTAEYAIRPYLVHYPEDCIPILRNWSHDRNLHERRLVSEGPRPRLPWAKRIKALNGDPSYNLALLQPLLQDPSFYVRKSVANHINDLTKDYKEITINWLNEQVERLNELNDDGKHVAWIVRHGLRSLVKAEDSEALRILEML